MPCRPELAKFIMRDRDDNRVIGVLFRASSEIDAIFAFGVLRHHPGIADIDVDAEILQLAHEVDDAGVAQVRAVLLEGKPSTSTRAPTTWMRFLTIALMTWLAT